MEEKKITISTGKEYTIKEVKYKDMVANASADNKVQSAKFLIQASCGMTDEEYEVLSMKDGITIQKEVNEVNGLNDSFLQTAPQQNSS